MNLPPGFQTMFPYMFCDDPNGLCDFLVQAFSAKEVNRTMRGDIVANLQIQLGTVNFMISQADENYPAMPSAYYLYVEDADNSMRKAIAAGAKLEMEAMDMSYGDRQGGVVDPFGNIWWVSQRLTDQPYST